MKPHSPPDSDDPRRWLLQELRVLAGEPDASLDAILRLARTHTGCAGTQLVLVDDETAWCRAAGTATATAESLVGSMHAKAIDTDTVFVLSEVVASPSFPRCYVAAPVDVEGHRVGLLCGIGSEPHAPSPDALAGLRDLAVLAGETLTARLREQRARLLAARIRTASRAAGDWLWETDADGIVTWLTVDLPERGTRNPGHALGDRWLQPYEHLSANRPDDWARCLAAFASRSAFAGIRTDGSSPEGTVTIESSGHPVFDSGGRFMGFRGASRDVTAELQQRAGAERALTRQQRELVESQARLSAILGAIPDLWFVLDEQGRYLESNAHAHPLLVPPFEVLKGRLVSEVLPESVAGACQQAIEATISTGRTQRIEYSLDMPGWGPQSFQASISPMPGRRALWLARDVTNVHALERDRLMLQRALEAETAMPIAVLDAAPHASPPRSTVVLVNGAFERLTGYSRAEMVGRELFVLQQDMPEQPGVQLLEDAMARGRACNVQIASRRKDGSQFTNELHLAPVHDAEGRLIQFVCVLNDVTARTLAAEQLRVSEELYRAVATTMSDGMLIVMATGAIAAVNPAGCSILGVEPGALIGQAMPGPFDLRELDGQTDADPSEHPVLRALQTGTPTRARPMRLHRADGSTRWLELNCLPLRVPSGGGASPLLVTFRDITAQRTAEQSLAASEERWKFALEGSRQGVWDWDARDANLYYSDAWKAILGHAPHEIGNSYNEWAERVHPEDNDLSRQLLASHLRGESPLFALEYRMRHRDGHYIWVHNRAKVVRRDESGRATRMVGTLVDVTAQRAAEDAQRAKQAAELASRAKTEFLSRMSHEMRTPLNAVIGFSQLLLNRPGDPDAVQVREYGEHVLRAGEHLLALINDVLDLQRVEEGRIVPQWSDVRVSTMAARVNELLAATATQHGVTIESRLDPDLAVRADERLLRQVLLNIASNAVKYNRAGGVLRWSAGVTGEGRVQIHVDDTGGGLTTEQLAKLFEPFERLGQETSAIQGTGLGLIIARRLCLAMGGALDVASRVGRGTRVTVTLPISREMSVPIEPVAVPTHISGVRRLRPPGAAPMRLLYVEDNRINIILFEAALGTQQGLELRSVEDGEAALREVTEWVPDVLVLDAHLPGMDGFELFQALRKVPGLERTPAYMCSADAMPEDIQRAQIAGFAGYWTKPIDTSRILSDLEDVSYALARRAERTRPPVLAVPAPDAPPSTTAT